MDKSYSHLYNMTILQKSLPLIIRACDMNTEQFANLLGITSQALRNIIFNKSKLTKSMFMAIMSALDYLRTEGENKKTLNILFNALFIPKNYLLFRKNIDNYLDKMKSSKKFLRTMESDYREEFYIDGTPVKGIPIIYVLCGARYATIEDLRKEGHLPKDTEKQERELENTEIKKSKLQEMSEEYAEELKDSCNPFHYKLKRLGYTEKEIEKFIEGARVGFETGFIKLASQLWGIDWEFQYEQFLKRQKEIESSILDSEEKK